MKTLFAIFLCLMLVSTITCCEKWDPAPGIDSNGLIVRIENDERETIAKYEYNKNGSLKSSWEINDYFYLGKKAEYKYEYDDNKNLVKKTGFEPGNMIMSSFTGAMDKEVTLTYEYNADGKIASKKIDFKYEEFPDINYYMQYYYEYPDELTIIETMANNQSSLNTLAGKNEYQFNNKGNIEKIISSHYNGEIERISSVEELTYDDKKTPVLFDPAPQSKNNITEKKITVYNYDENNVQAVAYSQVFEYEYDYNKNGYPEKIIETFPSTHFNTKYYFYKN